MQQPTAGNPKLPAGRLLTLGVVLYPFVIHIALYVEKSWIAIAYIALALTVLCLTSLYRKYWLQLLLSASILTGLVAVWFTFNTQWILYLPPVIIFAMLAWIFGRTLKADRVALITRIALVMTDNKLPQNEYTYTRQITKLWTVFFCLMCVESILLALFAPIMVWSTMTNFVNYIIVAAMFVIEFIARKIILKQSSFNSFFTFIRVMTQKRNEIREKAF